MRQSCRSPSRTRTRQLSPKKCGRRRDWSFLVGRLSVSPLLPRPAHGHRRPAACHDSRRAARQPAAIWRRWRLADGWRSPRESARGSDGGRWRAGDDTGDAGDAPRGSPAGVSPVALAMTPADDNAATDRLCGAERGLCLHTGARLRPPSHRPRHDKRPTRKGRWRPSVRLGALARTGRGSDGGRWRAGDGDWRAGRDRTAALARLRRRTGGGLASVCLHGSARYTIPGLSSESPVFVGVASN